MADSLSRIGDAPKRRYVRHLNCYFFGRDLEGEHVGGIGSGVFGGDLPALIDGADAACGWTLATRNVDSDTYRAFQCRVSGFQCRFEVTGELLGRRNFGRRGNPLPGLAFQGRTSFFPHQVAEPRFGHQACPAYAAEARVRAIHERDTVVAREDVVGLGLGNDLYL